VREIDKLAAVVLILIVPKHKDAKVR